jgi:F-type H+-transporting ATPase subunit b
MPQLNSATFVSQIFWLIVSFVIMWLVVGKFVVPRIGEIIKRRQRKIDDCISAAEGFKASAEELISRYNAAVARAEEQANDTWQKAQDEIKKQSESLQTEMNERLKKRLEDNEKNLRQFEKAVKSKVDVMAADLSEQIVSKLNISGIGREKIDEALKKDVSNG